MLTGNDQPLDELLNTLADWVTDGVEVNTPANTEGPAETIRLRAKNAHYHRTYMRDLVSKRRGATT